MAAITGRFLKEIGDYAETHNVPIIAFEKNQRKEDVAAEYLRRFDGRVADCGDCGRRVQGRHELQTSDALGAAAVQLGPDAHAAVAVLNKEFGLSHGKVAQVFERLFGLAINRSMSVRSMLRTAKMLEPAVEEIGCTTQFANQRTRKRAAPVRKRARRVRIDPLTRSLTVAARQSQPTSNWIFKVRRAPPPHPQTPRAVELRR